MSSPTPPGPPHFTVSTIVDAPTARVTRAFFSHVDLAYWCGVERSVTVARATGPFALTWAPSETEDDLLGQLGGTLHGTVMDYKPERELFIADVFWQPPSGTPLGPMALEVRWQPQADPAVTRVTVRQSASDDGPRWQRYFSVTQHGWTEALATLKDYVENEWLYRVKTLKQANP